MTDFNQKTHDTAVGSHGGQSRQMMEVFENQEFGSIRLLQEAGKTFFCASDVAKANPYAAVKRHCRGPLTKREWVVQKVNQYGDAGEQVVEISFIMEGDVYRLIVHSKLPSAERFEHWVFDEVLSYIRKHGVYMSDSVLDQVIQHPEVIYTLAQELVAEREQLEGIRKQLDAAQPKADYFDTFVNSEDCTCIRNFCKEIGIPEKTAVALLLDHRYLYRSPSGWLMPFADKSARGYFIVRDCYGRSGKLVQQTRVTCKGKNHLFKLQDLYEALLRQDEKEAHHVATALEIYVTGSLNLFNHRTNVDINNRLVCYDIKELGKQLKKIGMLVVQDQVWGRVTANRNAGKATRYYMDEFHLLLKEEQTAAYSVEIWKRFRKWGGIPTGITQNVKDLLSSREVTNIFENSDFIYMLNQAAGDRQILADQLNISPHQLSYVTHSGEGEGLLFYGNVILPFVDRFPTDLELYRIMTTKLTEVQEVKGV